MKAQTADESASFERPAARSSTVLRSVIAFIGSDRRFIVGGLLLILYILIALTGPSISPHDLNAPDLDVRLGAPTATHWLGTDRIGREALTRLIAGSQVSLEGGAGAALVGPGVGAPVGAWGRYVGGENEGLGQGGREGGRAF